MNVSPIASSGWWDTNARMFPSTKLMSVGEIPIFWARASRRASVPKSYQRAPSAYTSCKGCPPPHEHDSWFSELDGWNVMLDDARVGDDVGTASNCVSPG